MPGRGASLKNLKDNLAAFSEAIGLTRTAQDAAAAVDELLEDPIWDALGPAGTGTKLAIAPAALAAFFRKGPLTKAKIGELETVTNAAGDVLADVFHANFPRRDLPAATGLRRRLPRANEPPFNTAIHAGTERAALERASGTHAGERGARMFKGKVLSSERSLGSPEFPIGDSEMHSFLADHAGKKFVEKGGKALTQEEREILTRRYPWSRADELDEAPDVIFYKNFVEDPHTTSVAVLDPKQLQISSTFKIDEFPGEAFRFGYGGVTGPAFSKFVGQRRLDRPGVDLIQERPPPRAFPSLEEQVEEEMARFYDELTEFRIKGFDKILDTAAKETAGQGTLFDDPSRLNLPTRMKALADALADRSAVGNFPQELRSRLRNMAVESSASPTDIDFLLDALAAALPKHRVTVPIQVK